MVNAVADYAEATPICKSSIRFKQFLTPPFLPPSQHLFFPMPSSITITFSFFFFFHFGPFCLPVASLCGAARSYDENGKRKNSRASGLGRFISEVARMLMHVVGTTVYVYAPTPQLHPVLPLCVSRLCICILT